MVLLELMRALLVMLVVSSLVAIVGLLVVFLAAAAWTAGTARRPAPLMEELDRFLAETQATRL